MEIPKATDGNEDDMHSAFLSLTALQGHVTRATNNLSQTLGMEGPTKESITHAVDKLEKQLDKYTEQQMETVYKNKPKCKLKMDQVKLRNEHVSFV